MIYRILFICFFVLNSLVYGQDLNFKVKKTIANGSKIECLLLNKEGNILISGDHAGYLKFWSIPDGKLLYSIKAHNSVINCITLSNSGTKLVSAGSDGTIKLWSIAAQKLINSYNAPYTSVNFADITADERTIYYGGYNRGGYSNEIFTGFYKIDVYSKKQTKLFSDDASLYNTNVWGITDGIIDPTDHYVIFTKGYYMYVWSIQNNKLQARYNSRFNLNNLMVANDGNVYLWGEGMMILRDKSNNYAPKHTVAGTLTSVDFYTHIAMSKSGKYIVTGSDKNNVNIWNSSNLTKVATLTGHTNLVQHVLFANNDSLLISGAYDGNIIFWENEVVKKEPEVVQQVQQTEVKEEKKPERVVETLTTKVEEEKKEPKHEEKPTKDTSAAFSKNSSNTVFADKNIPKTVYGRPVEMQSEIKVKQKQLRLQVWDDYSEDGDIVSISLNGEWIIQNYTLKNEPKFIDIQLKPGNNYLVLFAHNTGDVPPNTAAVATEVNKQQYRLTISSDLKISGALNIIYEP